jgi:hypothetical protein
MVVTDDRPITTLFTTFAGAFEALGLERGIIEPLISVPANLVLTLPRGDADLGETLYLNSDKLCERKVLLVSLMT